MIVGKNFTRKCIFVELVRPWHDLILFNYVEQSPLNLLKFVPLGKIFLEKRPPPHTLG